MFEEYYARLKLENGATDDEIKKAYKKMAIKYHPDKNMSKTDTEKEDAEIKFKEITEAYEILTHQKDYVKKSMSGGVRTEFVDPYEIFNQLFKGMHVGDMCSDSTFNHGMNVTINVPNMQQSNCTMRSSTIRIQNGKKVETIQETINGITRQRVVVSNLDSPQQKSSSNIQNVIFRRL